MPRAVSYKANSIVFFEGDRNEFIYILQSGSVLLRYTDIESGTLEQDIIKTGEFFGVKSALGRYPKDETALVLRDSVVLVLTVSEFETMVTKNGRIIVKMLRVFSNQLRRVHKQVSNLLSNGKAPVDAEKGLYNTGEYYFTNNQFKQAAYIFKQYLTYYPQGEYATKASQLKTEAESCMQGKRPSIQVGKVNTEQADYGAVENTIGDDAKEYYNAVALFNQQQYEKALRAFKKINSDNPSSEYGIRSIADIGKCLYELKNWDPCIAQFTSMLQTYPKHPGIADALFYVGNCYKEKGDSQKAAGFYSMVLKREGESSPLHRKAEKALAELNGGN